MEDDERTQRLKHWEEQDAIVIERRKEAYDIGGEKQISRLKKQGKKPMRDLVRMLIDPGTEFFDDFRPMLAVQYISLGDFGMAGFD